MKTPTPCVVPREEITRGERSLPVASQQEANQGADMFHVIPTVAPVWSGWLCCSSPRDPRFLCAVCDGYCRCLSFASVLVWCGVVLAIRAGLRAFRTKTTPDSKDDATTTRQCSDRVGNSGCRLSVRGRWVLGEVVLDRNRAVAVLCIWVPRNWRPATMPATGECRSCSSSRK